MHIDIQLAIAGLGAGAAIALLAQGLVLIYRGSGVLNFAHGAIATFGTYVYIEARTVHSFPMGLAIIAGMAAAAAIGAAFQALVVRRLRHAPVLAKVVATLGLLVLLQSLIKPIFGDKIPKAPPIIGKGTFTLPLGSPQFKIGQDRLWLLVFAIIISGVLWGFYRWTRFGIATRATADNERATSLLGYSPSRISMINWAVGSALGALAGILLSPIVQVTPVFYTTVTIAAIAAALLGGFRSFSITLAGGIFIGCTQAVLLSHADELQRWTRLGGWPEALPFFIVAGVIIARGRAIPLRDMGRVDSLPIAGSSSRTRSLGASVVGLVAGIGWFLILPGRWADPLTATLISALLCLSLVVLTGFVGQISLAQMSFAGLGGFAASKFAVDLNFPFPLPLLCGALSAVPLGLLIGAPAVRVRGLSLAVVTLGAALALESMLFANYSLTGGAQGTKFPAAKLGPFDLNGVTHPKAYGIFTLVTVLLVCLAVSELRRRPLGLQFLAVRANERGASAIGTSLRDSKLIAFSIAAAIAGLAGGLIGYRSLQLSYNSFLIFQSILLVSLAYLGGIASVSGALVAGCLAGGGVLDFVLRTYVFNSADLTNRWLPIFTGATLIINVVMYPGGLVTIPSVMRGKRQVVRSEPSPTSPTLANEAIDA